MEKLIEKRILAIIPKYVSDKGNFTLVYTEKGIVEIEKSIKTVIKNISNYYHFDLKQSNNTYKNLLYHRKNPPVPFTDESIFILLKTRKPVGKHDGAHGYILIDAIEKIVFEEGKDIHPKILLTNGELLEVLCTVHTIRKSIKNGNIVKKLLQYKHASTIKEKKRLSLDGNMPATKADIALLFMEICKLQNYQ